MAGLITQLEHCWLLFRARSLPQTNSADKLEEVSAYSVIFISLGQLGRRPKILLR
jgi:hypothetical protein